VVVDIAVGGFHSLALMSDGHVVAWGDNRSGQNDVPEDLDDAVAISTGGFHVIALRENGEVVGWGSTRTENRRARVEVPEGLSDVHSIMAGQWHNLALQRDGDVVAWGSPRYGRTIVPENLHHNVAKIELNLFVSVARLASGEVVVWGNDRYGLNRIPEELQNVRILALGDWHGFAVLNNGDMYAWGLNDAGQLDVPDIIAQQVHLVREDE
jgi:alpha-tubulin suppressor-like RCC1 family protein